MARFLSVVVVALVSVLASLCLADDSFPCGTFDLRLPGSGKIIGSAASSYLQTKDVEYVRYQFSFASEELDSQFKFETADAHFASQFSDFTVSDKKTRFPVELFDFFGVPLEQSQIVSVDYPTDILPELSQFSFAMRVGYTSKNEGVEHNDHAWVVPTETRTDLWNKAENLPVFCNNYDYAGSVLTTTCTRPVPVCQSDYSEESTGTVTYRLPEGQQYMNNENCDFWIWPEEDFSSLNIEFTFLSTEEGYDFVTITDANGSIVQTISGELPEEGIQISSPFPLNIRFETDGSGRSLGFEVQWHIIEELPSTDD